MSHLVAFLDILGTKEMVKQDQFGDMHILDFANWVGLIARTSLNTRFAVFSDCVIMSTSMEKHQEFVAAISFIYSQWFSDYILVRGGISIGEIWWVDHSASDDLFHNLKNFAYSRVYGKALVAANKLEQSSGPGAICYVDESASEFLYQMNENYILQGQTDALVWSDVAGVDYFHKLVSSFLSQEEKGSEMRRHLKATVEYFSSIKKANKYLPSDFGYISSSRGR